MERLIYTVPFARGEPNFDQLYTEIDALTIPVGAHSEGDI